MARTIAELAQRKADLITELGDVNDEIRSRAGEVDPPGTPDPDESNSYTTVSDLAAERASDQAAKAMLDALAAEKGE